MDTPDEQWWDAQAGEYVLGTLRGAERDVFEKILKVDQEAFNRVLFWQQALSPMSENIDEIEPPHYVFPKITAQIQAQQAQAKASVKAALDDTTNNSATGGSTTPLTNTVVKTSPRRRRSSRSNRLWKGLTTLATAATIAMAALLVNTLNQPTSSATTTADSISIVLNEQKESLWVLSANSDTRELHITALNPPTLEAHQSHQLWMVKPDDAGVTSVGLLPTTAGTTTTLTLPMSTNEAKLFAVSLEVLTGSALAVPTGPVLYTGSIIPVQNP